MVGDTNSLLFSEYAIPMSPASPSQSDEILILFWAAAHMLPLRGICPHCPEPQSFSPWGSHHALFVSLSWHLFVQQICKGHLTGTWGPETTQSFSCSISESSRGDIQGKTDHNSNVVTNPSTKWMQASVEINRKEPGQDWGIIESSRGRGASHGL